MSKTVTIDPLTRIEGHLAIRTEVENGVIAKAYCAGEMFRGFEEILVGRDPLDAQQITQRICGVCPIAHGISSILAQDDAYDVDIPDNGRLLRNLILGANYIQSHILHFYHLAALDFVDIVAITKYQGKDPLLLGVKSWVESEISSQVLYPAAPFLPRYDADYITDTDLNITAIKHYLEALDMRRLAHKMSAIFAGRMPIAASLVPGGVTEKVTAKKIGAYASMLGQLTAFINSAYLPDVLEVALGFPQYFDIGPGCGNLMSYGVFKERNGSTFMPSGTYIDGNAYDFNARYITEDVKHSWYSSRSSLSPKNGQTTPSPKKSNAYSWLKAPRYNGNVMEVGPLARVFVAYLQNSIPKINKSVDMVLNAAGVGPEKLFSVLGRHAARAIECSVVADQCAKWLNQLKPGGAVFNEFEIPSSGSGIGLTEAPRGALGHWISIEDHKISNYQCVVPTTWNCSPRDDRDQPGAVEQAIEGTPVDVDKDPIAAARIVRSFDPCIGCAIH